MSSTTSSTHWHTITPQTRPLTLTILELTSLALTLSLTLAPIPTSPDHSPTQHLAHTYNHVHGPSKIRKKTRNRRQESDDELTAVEADDETSIVPGTYPVGVPSAGGTNFKDLLSHGVVVSVNGQPWSRIVAHVSDPDEEDADGEVAVEGIGGEDGEWEDDSDHAVEEGMTRRRPRKARFNLSAGKAVGDTGSAGERKKRRNEKDKEKWEKDGAVVVVYGLSPGKEYDVELRLVGLSGQDGESLGKCASFGLVQTWC